MTRSAPRRRKALGRRTPRIGVLSTEETNHAAVLQGIVQYMTENQPWELLTRIWIGLPYLKSVKDFDGDGLIYIGSADRERDLAHIAEQDIPVVYAATYPEHIRAPGAAIDEAAVGRMMAEHLMGAGLRQFGYFGEEGHDDDGDHPLNVRQRGFMAAVTRAGGTCEAYFEPGPWCVEGAWDRIQADLAKWMGALPKPAGIAVYNDPRGAFLLHTCRKFYINVPEEVAVIGVGNEPIVCDSVFPPMSSVDLGLSRVGYRAAEMLHGILQGRAAPAEPVLLEPLSVVPRRSSDVEAIDDPVVRECFDYIRRNLSGTVTVGDLLDQVRISQRSLEKRFHKALGRTPAAEIRRLQIEQAKRLLRESDQTIGRIAAQSGFASQTLFSVAFRRDAGLTASEYRRRIRTR